MRTDDFSIDRTDANNQINDVLSKLTALGTVLIPVRPSLSALSSPLAVAHALDTSPQMNLVTGLWGMNVHVPGEGVDGLGWFFGVRPLVSSSSSSPLPLRLQAVFEALTDASPVRRSSAASSRSPSLAPS